MRPSPAILPYLESGDILIDGGNSYYIDDIAGRKNSAPRASLTSTSVQRRRVGPGARLLHDDRRPRQALQYLDPIFKTLARA